MVGDLQQVDAGQSGRHESRIDPFLDIAGEQEALRADGPEHHDGHVVDARPVVRRVARDLAADRPQDLQIDPIHRQPIARREAGPGRGVVTDEAVLPRPVSRTSPTHAGLEHPADPISLEQEGQPCRVVLVRVRQDHGIDPAVPWRDQAVELDEQPVGIRPAIDEQASTSAAFHEDGVALADIEDRDPRRSRRS